MTCSRIISASLLSIGIAYAGYFIGESLIKTRLLDRYVVVKGLAEREVRANLAIWPINIKATGNNLIDLNNKIISDRNLVIDFLIEQGFKKEEIEIGSYSANDLLAQSFRNNNSQDFRYIINANIILKTTNIDLVKKTHELQNVLVQKGVVIGTDNFGNSNEPIYEFTKFTEIKTKMLEEAIKNARKSAYKFAEDSGSTLGLLKKANQGTFQISTPEGSEGADEYSNSLAARKSINKKIRVVTTLEYYLKDPSFTEKFYDSKN